jgi:hypothetical protein
MKIVEIYCQEERFNPRLNCTVSGAWMVRYENGIEVPICRDYEASNSKEALSILNQDNTTTWKHNAPFNLQFLGAQPVRAGQDY